MVFPPGPNEKDGNRCMNGDRWPQQNPDRIFIAEVQKLGPERAGIASVLP